MPPHKCGVSQEQAVRQAGRQAGSWASRQAGRQACRQASRQMHGKQFAPGATVPAHKADAPRGEQHSAELEVRQREGAEWTS